MSRLLLPSLVFAGLILPSLSSAQELPDRITKYFVGKWSVEGPEPGQKGTVDWKIAAAGKAVAGPGKGSKTGEQHHLGRWLTLEKTWEHAWAEEKGGYGRLELTRYESGSYYGKVRYVDEAGKDLSGRAEVKIIDNDNYEYIVTVDEGKLVSRWTRLP